jgi:N-acetylmuramoyl-L-alanine amidase
VIDAGHGGEDFGAVAFKRYEKDIALAVARKLQSRLQALGPVRMTREDDRYVPLDVRVQETADWDGALFISLHANKVFRKKLRGLTIYAYGPGGGRSDRRHRRQRRLPPLLPPPPEQRRASAALAVRIMRDLRRGGFPVEPVERADYYVLKNPRTPSVLVEMGYLSNPEESRLLADPAYQDRLADTLARSLSSAAAATAAPPND